MPVTQAQLEAELETLVEKRAALNAAQADTQAAKAATVSAQQEEAEAITAEADAGTATNAARDQLIADLQTFANGG